MKRSGNVFPSHMMQGQHISLRRSWKVKVTFLLFTIWFFTDNFFWTKHDIYKIRTVSCSSRQDASQHIHVDLERSMQNSASGQDHGVTQVAYESMCIDDTNTLRPL